jgi:hypothetical protein
MGGKNRERERQWGADEEPLSGYVREYDLMACCRPLYAPEIAAGVRRRGSEFCRVRVRNWPIRRSLGFSAGPLLVALAFVLCVRRVRESVVALGFLLP